ncbi:tRNA (guanine(10)-N(2))-dimethyltransferase [Candidatus Woesearchaeota archaeon]|nr:tRNA (guanine(10)-N(2))-dimethyltransferase [Candidatus Woesearchaeota archaeon]
MKSHVEGDISLFIFYSEKISKSMPVFYNPVMEFQRNLALLILKCWEKNDLCIADPLAGSGIRSLRMLKELPEHKISSILINDGNPKAVKLIKILFEKNKIPTKKAIILNKDTNKALLEGSIYDYIDIDPFGSPNPFLDNAIKKIAKNGILAITATDVAALAGTYKNACLRKYWALPLRNEIMHEIGVRILIRKAQLIAAQYDKALSPIFVHSTNHYLRAYLKVATGKSNVDKILENHLFLNFCKTCHKTQISQSNKISCCSKTMQSAGPLWTGNLWDESLLSLMIDQTTKHKQFLELIQQEAKIPVVGFFHIHKIAKLLRKQPPKKEVLIKTIQNKKYLASGTHFTPEAIKTTMPLDEFKLLF